jgi:hypothetical protein
MNGDYAKLSVELKKVDDNTISAKIEAQGRKTDIIEAWHRAGRSIAKQDDIPFVVLCAAVINEDKCLSTDKENGILIDLNALKNGGIQHE